MPLRNKTARQADARQRATEWRQNNPDYQRNYRAAARHLDSGLARSLGFETQQAPAKRVRRTYHNGKARAQEKPRSAQEIAETRERMISQHLSYLLRVTGFFAVPRTNEEIAQAKADYRARFKNYLNRAVINRARFPQCVKRQKLFPRIKSAAVQPHAS